MVDCSDVPHDLAGRQAKSLQFSRAKDSGLHMMIPSNWSRLIKFELVLGRRDLKKHCSFALVV
jgi:hypothetical protein